jgi:hypothetical protein
MNKPRKSLLSLKVGSFVVNEKFIPRRIQRIVQIYSSKEGGSNVYETEDGFLWDLTGCAKSRTDRERAETIREATEGEVIAGLLHNKRELIVRKLNAFHFLTLEDMEYIDEHLKKRMKEFGEEHDITEEEVGLRRF